MASSYSLAEDIHIVKEHYPYQLEEDFPPAYHISPYKKGLVITADQPDLIKSMHFSMVPTFFKEARSSMYNVKSTHLLSKQVLKQLMYSHKRCLILADGFYLWKRFGYDKFPFRFILTDRPVFAIAGLWSAWINPETAARYESFCMVTIPANPLVAQIKKSMPAILTPAAEKLWLNKNIDEEELVALCTPYPEEQMTKFMVSRELGDKSINDPFLFKPLNHFVNSDI